MSKLKGAGLIPFVHARTYDTSIEPRGNKLPSRVGKVDDVMNVLVKLDNNTQYTLEEKEKSLLLHAYQLKDTLDLLLKVQEVRQNEPAPTSTIPNILGRSAVVVNQHSFIENPTLVAEALRCFKLSVADENSIASAEIVIAKRGEMIPIVLSRLNEFRQTSLFGDKNLVYHWSTKIYLKTILRFLSR